MKNFYIGKDIGNVDTLDTDYPAIFKAVGSRNWGLPRSVDSTENLLTDFLFTSLDDAKAAFLACISVEGGAIEVAGNFFYSSNQATKDEAKNFIRAARQLHGDFIHVDDWLNVPTLDEKETYAKFVIDLYRLPAWKTQAYEQWICGYRLYCTCDNIRYLVIGASKVGDILLRRADSDAVCGYTTRVNVNRCSDWSSEESDVY